jgi:hypothetical protein
MTHGPDWLSDGDRAWVAIHGYLLEAIWGHFHATGDWPETVELHRRLHAREPECRPAAAIASMPRTLGFDEWGNPRQLKLTIFGLGCCSGARRLLTHYVAVAHLALQRFGTLELPNRLSRAEVVAELRLGEPEADRLSAILMRDADFLASGSSGLADWDREIDPRVVEFSGVEDPDQLLELLADRRRISPPVDLANPLPEVNVNDAEPPALSHDDSAQRRLNLVATLSTVALGVGGFLATLSGHSPLFAGILIVVVLVIGLIGYSVFEGRPRRLVIALVVSICLGALIAGWLLRSTGPPHLYRYFASPRGEAVAIPVIEPRPDAMMANSAVYGAGDQVEVLCVGNYAHISWAKLPDATFIPLRDLTAEFAATDGPPTC